MTGKINNDRFPEFQRIVVVVLFLIAAAIFLGVLWGEAAKWWASL